MLVINASAKPSEINGLGLFADEKISKGTVTWKYSPIFDISFSIEDLDQMTSEQKDLIKKYAYFSKQQDKYIYSIDDSRFTNHSSTSPNIDAVLFPGEVETSGVANRDIEAGEEILVNYRAFDKDDESSRASYLDS